MKKFVLLLAVVFVSAGSAQARISGMSSLSHAHFPTCSDGLVQKLCVCRRAGEVSGPRHQLCRVGWYCHTFDGACRQ
jgi:hypothetical protein